MTSSKVNICGITPKHCLPECCPPFFTQVWETDKLTVVGMDPDIQELIQVSLRIDIRNFRVLCTVTGKKLIVHATKNIEMIFKNCGIKYVSRFAIPFCSLVDDMNEKVTGIKFLIEDIDVFQSSTRCVAVSAVILVVPDVKAKNDEWHDANTIRCDIKLQGG